MALAIKCDLCGKLDVPYIDKDSVNFIDFGPYDLKHRSFQESLFSKCLCRSCSEEILKKVDELSKGGL